MHRWALSLRPDPGSDLPAADVAVEARPGATVADLAVSLGRHLAPQRAGLLVVPVEGGRPWAADLPLDQTPLRDGDLLDVVTVTDDWLRRPGRGAEPRATLRVLSGPDAGRSVTAYGDAVVGRASDCTLALTDPAVSHRHLLVRLDRSRGVVLVDQGSANGTRVDDVDLVRPTPVEVGAVIRLGSTTIAVEPAGAGAPSSAVLRPPRFGAPLDEGEVDVASPPTKQRPSPLPWTMLAMPLVMGVAFFGNSRSPWTLVYVFAWPLVALGGWWQQKRAARREFEAELADWRIDVDETVGRLDAAALAQRARLEEDHPEPTAIVGLTAAREARLWHRAPRSADFLAVRVGRGPVPAALTASIGEGGDRETRRGVRAELAAREVLTDAPLAAPLADDAVVALVGTGEQVDDAARALVLRLVFDHSPHDLAVAAVLGAKRRHHESWLRWLPHLDAAGGESAVALGAHDGERLLERLVAGEPSARHTVCLVDAHAGVPRRVVEAVAAAARERGVHLVWLGTDADSVPAATDTLLDVADGVLARRERTARVELAGVDACRLPAAWATARLMHSCVDEAAVLSANAALPGVVRLPELCADLTDPDDVDAVLARWEQRSGLRAQIGAGADGVVSIDLREDGPHGLVAGTTGSGKSELLQSLICSLAINNPPERMNFLLVDYKGGAAFRECADLPHTVGYITDLTPALVQRALTSLGAEISHREELLGEYRVKDLPQLERERPDVAPPALLICVDEFAALAAEVPEFVEGMVNLAQRGRSLGMHVLLATQRPSGVVTPAIKANCDLRISLRVSSADDSRDVLDGPEAAGISRRTPGRAWIRRTGHGTAELVQSAWLGARERLDGPRNPVRVEPFSAVVAAAGGVAPGASGSGADGAGLHPATDLERCVSSVSGAFERSGRDLPRKPWLPALPADLLIDPLRTIELARTRRPGQVPLGLLDLPATQSQPELVVDYAADGHLLVYGASGAGKTELLRSLAVAVSLTDSHAAHTTAPYVYGLDFAGGGLGVLEALPTTASVVTETQPGRVLRLIRLLERTVVERSASLAACGAADLEGLADAGHRLPRVHVLIDNLPALLEHLEGGGAVARDHSERLMRLLQNGRRTGVHVTATAAGRTGLGAAVSSAFGRRVVLRMTTADDYAVLGVPAGVLDSDTPAGRGLAGKHGVQLATLGGAGTPVAAQRLADVAELLRPLVAARPSAGVAAMPSRLPVEALPPAEGAAVPLAVDAEACRARFVDLLAGPVLVAGRQRTGRTSALEAVAALAVAGTNPPAVVVRVAAGGPSSGRPGLPGLPGEVDLAGPVELLQWWRTWRVDAEGWALVLVDDADRWGSSALDADARAAVDELAGPDSPDSIVAAAASGETSGAGGARVALVVSADVAQVRARSAGAIVDAVKVHRRGALLAPEWNDGDVLGVEVPTKTTEPLSGLGRGLLVVDGDSAVVQLAAATRAVPLAEEA